MDQKTEVDQEIDEVLGLINKELTTTDTKEITKKEELSSIEFLVGKAIKNIDTVDNTADDIHELFFRELLMKRDHSESSKVAMIEALKIKSENIKTISDLMKSIIRLKTSQETKVGIQINTQTGEDVGINLNALKEEV
jgi:hypothetical protein